METKFEFVKVEGEIKESSIQGGVFLKNGVPFAYGHYRVKDGGDNVLCLAFRKGESDHVSHSKFVVSVWEATGLFRGVNGIRVTENNFIVNNIIEKWNQQHGEAA